MAVRSAASLAGGRGTTRAAGTAERMVDMRVLQMASNSVGHLATGSAASWALKMGV